MTKVIGVRFRTAGKIYFFSPGKFEVKRGDQVIVETARGVEFGNVVMGPKEVKDEEITQPLKTVIRLATEDDRRVEEKNRKKEEANKKPSIAERIKNSATKKKDEKEEDPEKKFKGLHLNDIKLYIAALRKKMKDMSSKEKEMSRNLDTYMGMMQKSIKDALISDRRESIIKGSVIPSFSKAMKICIGLAGVTIIAPPIGIIAAVGGLAMSKNLTKKERMLLLDELEVEMEVIDKEIELAQNRNQIKRYRQLLQYKKKCQREYQS